MRHTHTHLLFVGRRSVAYHVEGPVFVDNDSLSDCGTVHINDPEQRRQTRPRSHLASQTYVFVSNVRRRRTTANYRTIYHSVTVDVDEGVGSDNKEINDRVLKLIKSNRSR